MKIPCFTVRNAYFLLPKIIALGKMGDQDAVRAECVRGRNINTRSRTCRRTNWVASVCNTWGSGRPECSMTHIAPYPRSTIFIQPKLQLFPAAQKNTSACPIALLSGCTFYLQGFALGCFMCVGADLINRKWILRPHQKIHTSREKIGISHAI